MPALERRRLENRSREEGPGSARDETVGVAETSWSYATRERALGQAALFLRSRFEEPNRLKKLHEPALRHAPRHVGLHDLTLSLLFSVCFCFLRFFR